MKKYILREVKPKIFLLDLRNSYDLAMHFMRYQEYYESASPRFRDNTWFWVDFMKWYSKKHGKGVFTYARDWAGFNIPGDTIDKVWSQGIPDVNQYDKTMWEIAQQCKDKAKGDFYLIGATGKTSVLKHEIAHGFFYTIPEYKQEMTQLNKKLTPAFRKQINVTLKKMGYTPKVYVDECQAYLATGVAEQFTMSIKNEDKPFVSLYNKYYRKL
jgi:hypothetical protein